MRKFLPGRRCKFSRQWLVYKHLFPLSGEAYVSWFDWRFRLSVEVEMLPMQFSGSLIFLPLDFWATVSLYGISFWDLEMSVRHEFHANTEFRHNLFPEQTHFLILAGSAFYQIIFGKMHFTLISKNEFFHE